MARNTTIKIKITQALIEDITHQLNQAEHFWHEFLYDCDNPLSGDPGKIKKMANVIERWEKLIRKGKL